MKKKGQSKISKEIYRRHLQLVRDLNDMHIFINQSLPILEDAKRKYASSNDENDKKYYVPSVKKTRIAQRNDSELKKIYEKYLKREIFESFLTTCVSRYEDFLFFSLKTIIKRYPHKLLTNVDGVRIPKEIQFDTLLMVRDLEALIELVITHGLISVSYAGPNNYIKYFSKVSGVEFPEETVGDYCELKATRDIVIHNNSIVNEVYIKKVDSLARSSLNKKIPIDQGYFEKSVALLKRMSGIVRREVDKIYPP